jgi:nitrous oxidase accessory protein NosD
VRKVLFVLPVSLFIFFSASCPAFAQFSNASANILVDDDKVQCPSAQFTTIQSAVNAATSGDVIRVCAGTYPEQVIISKPLTLRADNGVVVIPSGMTQNSTGAAGGDSIAAIFVVQGVQDVDLDGFIVDGSNNGLTGCSPRLIGIDYENASGHIRHNAVRHISLGSADSGCQSGNGIEVETGSGSASDVKINDNSVWDYQKNGITGNEQGTQLSVDGNVVTGIGPTPNIAQNGIQIGFGAAGKVANNTVADNIYSVCSSSASCPTNATGILIFESDGVSVRNNSLATNQIGVFIGGQNSIVASNTISNSLALIGVALVGDQNSAARNTLTHADQAAVYIQGNGNRVTGNDITDAAIGVLKISGSTGSTIHNNTFFATLITVQDPAPTRPIGVSPVR